MGKTGIDWDGLVCSGEVSHQLLSKLTLITSHTGDLGTRQRHPPRASTEGSRSSHLEREMERRAIVKHSNHS